MVLKEIITVSLTFSRFQHRLQKSMQDSHGFKRDNNSRCNILMVSEQIIPVGKHSDGFNRDFKSWCNTVMVSAQIITVGATLSWFQYRL